MKKIEQDYYARDFLPRWNLLNVFVSFGPLGLVEPFLHLGSLVAR